MKGLTNHQAAAVIDEVAREHGVTAETIKGKSRCRPHVLARREVWQRLIDSGASITDTGYATGHHYSTVMHGLALLRCE